MEVNSVRFICMIGWKQINSIWGAWDKSPRLFHSANLVLNIVENIEGLDEQVRTRILAEVRGVRAFWLYLMMDFWGNIPLVTDFTQTDLPVQSSRKEVYNFILKELNEIKDIVREDVTPASYGKFTKGAAYTLLAKMYLNAEAWGVDDAKWAEAEEALNVVMELDYQIEPNWKTNFIPKNEVQEKHFFRLF